MSKPKTQTTTFILLAAVAGIAALVTLGGLSPGFVPTCDGKLMGPGDGCIGTGGGTYDQMVHDHYRNDAIAFAITLPLTIVFIVLAVREYRRGRLARAAARSSAAGTAAGPPRAGAPNKDRVTLKVTRDAPGTGVWMLIRFDQGRRFPSAGASSDLSLGIQHALGELIRNRDPDVRTDRHTWINLTCYLLDENDRTIHERFARIAERAFGRVGIDAEHTHITPRLLRPTEDVPAYYSQVKTPFVFAFPRVEFDMIQPGIERRVRRWNIATATEDDFPGGHAGGSRQDRFQCPIDHLATAPADDVLAIWKQAWSGPRAKTSAPVHAELIAVGRCPACPTEKLEQAPAVRTRDGRERTAGRCPCCDARWLTDEPTGWACLDTGRLAPT